jgi:phosphopantetheinyl transferase (holo-ACP synthase)
MEQVKVYSKHVAMLKKEEFISFFSSCDNPEKVFSFKELQEYPFPENAKSLAGRYLIKKEICNHINDHDNMHEIEILNNSFGKPEISLGINIRSVIERTGIKKIHCSISHSKNLITGMTIFCF